MEWRSVQVWLPRVSTSGGQSSGRVRAVEVVEAVVVVVVVEEEGEVGSWEGCLLVRANQSATEVQVRHLRSFVSLAPVLGKVLGTHGFPSLPNTTPLGSFFGPPPPSTLPPCCSRASSSLPGFFSDFRACSAKNFSMLYTTSCLMIEIQINGSTD